MTVGLLAPGTVRLNDGPFLRSQRLNQEYLLQLDPQRLLAPFMREAGLRAAAKPYGNWESEGLDGHTAGHYLSATSLTFAYTGDTRFFERAREVVSALARAQDAIGSGYIGGIPNSAELWAEVAAGRIDSTTFTHDGRWVPWYNLHKTFAGLIEAYRSAHIEQALAVVTRLADWWLEIAAGIDDSDFELMLDTEFGGMNESFADLAAITSRDDYLAMATRFSHHAVFDPLAAGEDALTGLHANTQIPKALGYQRIAQLTGDPNYGRAAAAFFDIVTTTRGTSIGGHGVREHFTAPGDVHAMIEDREGPESCNTYNMVRLAGDLYLGTGMSGYIDYIERALHNHILSAQHPGHGGFVYFTPMRPNHYRVYSEPENSFWCCVGTGMEAHARHAAYIYAERHHRLAVNLFIDSTITWRDITLTQHATGAPRFGTTITIETDKISGRHAERRVIDIRIPSWADGPAQLTVNGQPLAAPATDGYLSIDREWVHGDTLSVTFPASPRFERLGDDAEWVSVVWGPIVYASVGDTNDLLGLIADAGRMSHIARGPLTPLAESPIVVGSDSSRSLIGLDDGSVTLATDRGPVPLVPFARIHDSRYTIYFPVGADAEARRRQLLVDDQRQLGVDALTQDFISLGQQQPESDHGFHGPHSETGRDGDIRWRRTSTSMSATLQDWRRSARFLRLSWLDGDGSVGYELVANGVPIGTIVREGGKRSPDVRMEQYELPAEFAAMDIGRIEITARAFTGHTTDRITELRLLAAAPI
jgi:DUF1680 family protein